MEPKAYAEYPEYGEYLASLTEQIHSRRARAMVEREIRDHLEEQCGGYEAAGMPREQAVRETVRQMGDPVETGRRLNQIHRPRTPILLLALILTLTAVGVGMQAILFRQLETLSPSAAGGFEGIYPDCLIRTLLYNLTGLAVVLAVMCGDYNVIGRYAYHFYGVYLCAVFLGGWIRFSSWFSYGQSLSYCYYVTLLLPPVLAGLIYRNRGRRLRGLLRCMLLELAALAVLSAVPASVSGLLECGVICTALLGIAVGRGIFGGKKGPQAAVLAAPPVLAGLGTVSWAAVLLRGGTDRVSFRLQRLMVFLSPEKYKDAAGYQMNLMRGLTESYTLFGERKLPLEESLGLRLGSDFVLSGIFSWFGIAAGAAVLGLMLFFVIRSLAASLGQSNRLGMLLGSAGALSVLVRSCAFAANNFGYNLFYTTSIPFLTFGLGNALLNGVIVGLILCVYRNSYILGEQSGAPRRGKRYVWRLRLEKAEV